LGRSDNGEQIRFGERIFPAPPQFVKDDVVIA
jgi:hypothetical protein